jgi:hypothetical protein
VRFGLQTTLSVLKHGDGHFSGDSRKPGKEIVDPRAAFKIFEQRFNRHSSAAKYPGTNPIRIALDSRARRPIQHGLRLTAFHPFSKFPRSPAEKVIRKALLAEQVLLLELLHRYGELKVSLVYRVPDGLNDLNGLNCLNEQRLIAERFGGLDEGLVIRDRRAIRKRSRLNQRSESGFRISRG